MERLTEKVETGFQCNDRECRLSYCDMGCGHYQLMLNKLADLEDAEEQGLLLRLPYPLKTWKVYALDEGYDGVPEVIELKANNLSVCHCVELDRPMFIVDTFEYLEEDFGKKVFLTREEAEKELARLKNNE